MLFTWTCKDFHTISHNLTIDKQMKYGLDKGIVRWTENCPEGCDQQDRVQLEANHQWYITGLSAVVSAVQLIYDLNDEKECSLSKFADDTKIGSSG